MWLTVSAFLCAWSEGSCRVPHVPPRGCTGDPRVVSLVASAPETEARGCLSTGFYASCIMCAPNRSLDPRPPGGDDQGRVQVCGLCHLEHTCEGLGTGGTGICSPFLTLCLMPGRACGLPSAGGRRRRGAPGRGRAGTGRSGAPASGTCQGSGCRRPPCPAGGGHRALLRVVLQEWAWQCGAGQLPGARGPGPAAAARLSSGGACQRVSPCCRGDRGAAWKRHQPVRCGSSAGRRSLTCTGAVRQAALRQADEAKPRQMEGTPRADRISALPAPPPAAAHPPPPAPAGQRQARGLIAAAPAPDSLAG